MANLKERWESYQPEKSLLFWSFAAGVVVTFLVGFAGFNWYTAGSALEMAESRADDARAQLASTICVERFMDAPNAGERLAALKGTNSFNQDTYIEDKGWVTFDGLDRPIYAAADICADRLVGMEVPEPAEAGPGAQPEAGKG